ncbi:ATP-grasp domain-containing protein [Streptomyces sp. NBC_00882]|uniref:ATP-grasp domain-containing protein n=1 Tax=Streptomyces TaxID=1883 RepID=UPI00386E2C17|nr:ATP-grasp domain-containing protein [Streptomyces sp. NBC_00882]WSZ60872.1 ATP-grasp domain-containing protein [Streptomyces canus]
MQRPHSAAEYDRWLRAADPDVRITLLTSADTVRRSEALVAGARRIVVDDYESPLATAELFRLCDADRPDRIFVNSEDDVLRAAEARALFGIPGPDPSLALRFRDKIAMKQLFEGLPVSPVPYREVRCSSDLSAAQEELGAVVVKPRDGAGSAGVRVLSDGQAVRRACLDDPGLLTALHSGGLMAEQYIEGTVYHVDVLVDGGSVLMVSPSRYLDPPHLFRTHNLGSVMLDVGSPRAKLLTDAAERFVARLPEGHGTHVLHMEFLEDRSGAFFAGEVACRTGGALIKNSVRHTYGIDLSKAACLLAAGLWTGPEVRSSGAARTGWLLWTGGTRPRPPAGRPDWLVEFTEAAEAEHERAPIDAVDGKARVLVEGADEEEAEERMRSLCRHG